MQRSTMTEATFITTSAGQRAYRGLASIVAVALVGTTPWMVSQSTLAQDAPANQSADSSREGAREAMSRSEWKKAIDLWSTLQTAVPGDAEAMKGMQRAQAALAAV